MVTPTQQCEPKSEFRILIQATGRVPRRLHTAACQCTGAGSCSQCCRVNFIFLRICFSRHETKLYRFYQKYVIIKIVNNRPKRILFFVVHLATQFLLSRFSNEHSKYLYSVLIYKFTNDQCKRSVEYDIVGMRKYHVIYAFSRRVAKATSIVG
jgi:hypothetical protein